jgi:hypothetical protein
MKQTQDLLFMTYQLKHNEHELDISYYGCGEIVIPDYKRPSYIRGMIEFEGNYIPVIDPNIYYQGQPTQLTNLACILVIRHFYEYRNHQTGIILEALLTSWCTITIGLSSAHQKHIEWHQPDNDRRSFHTERTRRSAGSLFAP